MNKVPDGQYTNQDIIDYLKYRQSIGFTAIYLNTNNEVVLFRSSNGQEKAIRPEKFDISNILKGFMQKEYLKFGNVNLLKGIGRFIEYLEKEFNKKEMQKYKEGQKITIGNKTIYVSKYMPDGKIKWFTWLDNLRRYTFDTPDDFEEMIRDLKSMEKVNDETHFLYSKKHNIDLSKLKKGDSFLAKKTDSNNFVKLTYCDFSKNDEFVFACDDYESVMPNWLYFYTDELCTYFDTFESVTITSGLAYEIGEIIEIGSVGITINGYELGNIILIESEIDRMMYKGSLSFSEFKEMIAELKSLSEVMSDTVKNCDKLKGFYINKSRYDALPLMA